MDTVVRNNPEAGRYELLVDERVVGVADYVLRGDVVVLPHTEINPSLQGQGLGAKLVRGVLDDVRAQGRTVVPSCWYVAQYIDEHPADADLLARATR